MIPEDARCSAIAKCAFGLLTALVFKHSKHSKHEEAQRKNKRPLFEKQDWFAVEIYLQ
jgi:predicted outer membrane lipoprotein